MTIVRPRDRTGADPLLQYRQEERAIEDADLFNRRYGRTRPALGAEIALAVAGHQIND